MTSTCSYLINILNIFIYHTLITHLYIIIYLSAQEDSDRQHMPDLRDFLLQSSDEEDVGGFELSDPQVDSEAEVMAYFSKNQTNRAQQPDEMSVQYMSQ